MTLENQRKRISSTKAVCYLSYMTFARLANRPLSDEGRTFTDRMREQFPRECAIMDRKIDREMETKIADVQPLQNHSPIACSEPTRQLWNSRATGKTTRMLIAAIGRARSGKTTIVVVENVPIVRNALESMLQNYGTVNELRKLIHLIGASNTEISWKGDRPGFLPGRDPDSVFIDHYSIEKRFSRVLEMFHRFDAEAGS